jgi:hypothetical protein
MIFAISPTKLSVILVLVLVLVAGGFFVRLLMGRAYRKPLGALALVALPVLAFGGSAWIWDNVTDEEAVSVILVAMVGAAALLLVLRVRRLAARNRVLPIVLSAVIAVIGVGVALLAVDQAQQLGEQTAEVPTMLFGLGAIALAREPRGVLYDMVNRIRLRQMRDAERRDEEAMLVERRAPAGATA